MRKWRSSGRLNGSYTVPVFGFSFCHSYRWPLENSICGQFCWCRPTRILSGKYGVETGEFWDSASPLLPFAGNTQAVHTRRGNRNGTIRFSTTLRTGRPNPRWVKTFLSSPCGPHRIWGPSTFLFIGYWGLAPRGQRGRDVMLTTNLHLVKNECS